ncbi:MAG: ribosomal-processing cysteine protease Prp [Ruminococcus sp.]|nr:ribosomal-processing cysteine protease Prp [Ruminococcus sp.]
MINAMFFKSGAGFSGFSISGHSGFAQAGSDVCCAAVSSAAELVCNALTDFMAGSAEAEVKENALECRLTSPSEEAYRLMNAFYAHLEFIQEDYPENIKVTVK